MSTLCIQFYSKQS